jgi:hypothetical protein
MLYERYSDILEGKIATHPQGGAHKLPARMERTVEARVLKFFLRVAGLGGINRAVAELRLSQPSPGTFPLHAQNVTVEVGAQ